MLQIEAKNKTDVIKVADWSTETGYKGATNYVKEKFPRFFRIGTVVILTKKIYITSKIFQLENVQKAEL